RFGKGPGRLLHRAARVSGLAPPLLRLSLDRGDGPARPGAAEKRAGSLREALGARAAVGARRRAVQKAGYPPGQRRQTVRRSVRIADPLRPPPAGRFGAGRGRFGGGDAAPILAPTVLTQPESVHRSIGSSPHRLLEEPRSTDGSMIR